MKIQELKTVYHTTKHDVDEFRPLSHFGSPASAADMFQQNINYKDNPGQWKKDKEVDPYRTYRANIDMKNPAIMWDTKVPHNSEEILGGLIAHAGQVANGKIDNDYGDLVSKEDLYILEHTPLNYTIEDLTDLRQMWRRRRRSMPIFHDTYEKEEAQQKNELVTFLKKFGHDGIKYINRSEGKGDWSYINLDPIKAESMNEALVAPSPEQRVPFIKWWARYLKTDPGGAQNVLLMMQMHIDNMERTKDKNRLRILSKLRWQFQQANRKKDYRAAANLYQEFIMQTKQEVLVASEAIGGTTKINPHGGGFRSRTNEQGETESEEWFHFGLHVWDVGKAYAPRLMQSFLKSVISETLAGSRYTIWYNPRNNEVKAVQYGKQHDDLIEEDPKWFGIDEEKMKEISPYGYPNSQDLYDTAFENGFIRSWYRNGTIGIESIEERNIPQYIVWAKENFKRLNHIDIDLIDGTEMTLDEREIDEVLMTGKIPRETVIS